MAEDIVIVGAGGFGRETADVVEAINQSSRRPVWRLLGIVDDSLSLDNDKRLSERRIPHLGAVDSLVAGRARPKYVVGIGSPSVRQVVANRLHDAGFAAATLVHPAATFGSNVRIGAGTIVCAGVRLTTNVCLGRHVHLNPNVTVGHDTTIGDFVSMNPASSVSGDCAIGEGVLIGVGGVVLNRLAVGTGAIVGGGACVVVDVDAGAVVVGVPARPLER